MRAADAQRKRGEAYNHTGRHPARHAEAIAQEKQVIARIQERYASEMSNIFTQIGETGRGIGHGFQYRIPLGQNDVAPAVSYHF
jgi:hypothetical protein